MPLADLVDVSISVEAAPLTPAGFGRACIVGQHTRFAERFRLYTSLQGMLDDGFTTSDAEYIEAASLLAQSAISGRRVRDFLVGRRATPVAQVSTGTVVYDAAQTVSVTVSRVGIPATTVTVPTDTDAATTRAALVTALNNNATLGPVLTAAGGAGGEFTITSDVAGISLSLLGEGTGSADVTFVATTPNTGIVEDMNAIVDAGAAFYVVLTTSRSDAELVQLAGWVESASPSKIALVQSNTSSILAAAYNPANIYADIASELKGLNYNRTALLYHANDAQSAAGALAGRCLPFDPGTQTWALKQLSGVTTNALTGSQMAILRGTPTQPTSGKNGNVLAPLTDQANITFGGTMASGRYIDVQRTIDWFESQISTGIANLMLSANKIPFDNRGISRMAAVVDAVMAVAKSANILDADAPYTVEAPDISEISVSDRAARVLNPPIKASGRLSGAIHHAQISISLTQ